MAASGEGNTEFERWFRPIFLYGYGAFVFALNAYAFYREIRTGDGPSILYELLPIAVFAAIGWAVLSVPLAFGVIGIRRALARWR